MSFDYIGYKESITLVLGLESLLNRRRKKVSSEGNVKQNSVSKNIRSRDELMTKKTLGFLLHKIVSILLTKPVCIPLIFLG